MSRRPLRTMIVAWSPGKPIDDCVKAIGMLLNIQEREAKLLRLDKVDTPFDELSAMSTDDLEQLVAKWADDLAAPVA